MQLLFFGQKMQLLFFLLFLLSVLTASTTFDDLPPPLFPSSARHITEKSKVMPLLNKFKSSLMLPDHLPLLLVIPNPALHRSICPELNTLYSNLMEVLQSQPLVNFFQTPTAIVLTINVDSQAMHSQVKEYSNGDGSGYFNGGTDSSRAGSSRVGSVGSSGAGSSNSSDGAHDGNNDDGIWKSGARSSGAGSSNSSDEDDGDDGEDDRDNDGGTCKSLPESLRQRLEDLCSSNPKLCNMLIGIWESLPESLRTWLEDKLAADGDGNDGASTLLPSLWEWLEEGWLAIEKFTKHFKEFCFISTMGKAAWEWRYYLFILAGLIFLWRKHTTKRKKGEKKKPKEKADDSEHGQS